MKKSKETDESYVSPTRASHQVRVSRSAYGKAIAKQLRGVVVGVIVVVAVVYVALAGTIFRVIPTTSGAGLVPVKNITYDGGIIPADAYLLIDVANEQKTGPTDVVDKLRQSFIPSSDTAVVRVAAGPYGEMQWAEPDVLTVSGSPVGVSIPAIEGVSPLEERNAESGEYLKGEYVVECVQGACNPGTGAIIPQEYIYGELVLDVNTDNDGE